MKHWLIFNLGIVIRYIPDISGILDLILYHRLEIIVQITKDQLIYHTDLYNVFSSRNTVATRRYNEAQNTILDLERGYDAKYEDFRKNSG